MYGRIKGGWPSMHHALCAMAYSCLTIHKQYPDIHLYTDDFGASLLINELKLPYKEVHTTLNNFDVNLNLWALAKVCTYSLQEVPFIHIDNDIFIWERLPVRVETASLCAQNIERFDGHYSEALDIMTRIFTQPKSDFPLFYSDNSRATAYNAGILGGRDIDFIHEYACEALNMYEDHKAEFHATGENIGMFNIVLEQLLFGMKVGIGEKTVESLIEANSLDEAVNKVIGISEAPISTKYVHCLGEIKKSLGVADQIKYRLKYEYPYWYRLVTEYCEDNLGHTEPVLSVGYKKFEYAYRIINGHSSIEDFMNKAQFILHPDAVIKVKDENFWLVRGFKIKRIAGWGKILLMLTSKHTGAALADKMDVLLKGSISRDIIYENVASFLMQTLYRGDTIIKI